MCRYLSRCRVFRPFFFSSLLRDRRFGASIGRYLAKILGAAGALSDHGSPRQVCPLTTYLGISAQDVQSALSQLPPPPPTNCAAASTGVCLEPDWDGDFVDKGGGAVVDDDCCAPCGEGSCAPGYTYAGQVIFDKETLSSTYPDFYPFCSLYCGNTCCVPSDEWDGARAAAGK